MIVDRKPRCKAEVTYRIPGAIKQCGNHTSAESGKCWRHDGRSKK